MTTLQLALSWTWTVIGVVGFVFALYIVYQVWLDLRYLKEEPDFRLRARRHIVARAHVRSAVAMGIATVCFVAVGALVLIPGLLRSAPNWLFSALFLTIEICVVAERMFIPRDRALLERQVPRDP